MDYKAPVTPITSDWAQRLKRHMTDGEYTKVAWEEASQVLGLDPNQKAKLQQAVSAEVQLAFLALHTKMHEVVERQIRLEQKVEEYLKQHPLIDD